MNEQELLRYALEHDMINMSCIEEQIEMNKRREILNNHPYSIWEGKDGKWRTYFQIENGKRVLKKLSTKNAIEDAIVAFYQGVEEEKKRDYSFKFFFNRWREKQISYELSNNTISKYDSDYIRYFKDTDFERLDIRIISEEDITAFVISCIKRLNLKEKAGKSLMGYINGVFKHARIKKIIKENPCDYVETKDFARHYNRDYKSPEERIINNNDIVLLLNQIYLSYKEKPNYIPSYAVEFAIYTGMRIGEITGLKWDAIKNDSGVIVIRSSEKYDRLNKSYYIDSTKTQKERLFPLSDKLIDILHRVKKVEMQYGYLGEFVFQNEKGKIHSTAIDHCIRYKCKKAGIPEKSIQSLRRTLNSKLKCEGVSSTVASALLGHTEKVNQLNYTYDVSNIEYKREVLERVYGNI